MILFLSLCSFADDAAKTVASELPGIVELLPLLDSTNALDPKSVTGVKTQITTEAANVDTALQNEFNSGFSAANSIPGFPLTKAELLNINANIKTYVTVKRKACTSNVETAGFICVEGTSPGAKIVRRLMDAGAPLLKAISSAQKACSTTASLTSLAGDALLAAKGVCVAAKATCDFSCSATATEATRIIAQLNAVKLKIVQDKTLACESIALCPAAQTGAVSLNEVVDSFIATLKKESSSNPGTAANLASKCSGYSKDLAVLGTNLVAILASQKSASECASKLASSDQKTTALQYCENPANANTQFCICNKTPTAAGCPNANSAAALTTTNTPASENGVDVKNTGSGNQFASGGVNGKPSNALSGVNGSGALAGTNPDGTKANAKTDSPTAGGSGLGVSSTGGSGGFSSGDAPSADIAGANGKMATPEDKKKWGFGAFSAIGGGGSGGGDGSSGAGGKNKLGQKDMDAIQRQIASEQFRAEVSEASGKSNWEKVRQRYLSNTPSFLNGK